MARAWMRGGRSLLRASAEDSQPGSGVTGTPRHRQASRRQHRSGATLERRLVLAAACGARARFSQAADLPLFDTLRRAWVDWRSPN